MKNAYNLKSVVTLAGQTFPTSDLSKQEEGLWTLGLTGKVLAWLLQ